MCNTYVAWQGPSRIDGAPIVLLASLDSRNPKTGNCVQTWIVRQDESPPDAKHNGNDHAICGDCPIRSSCYVATHQAPRAVWHAYRQGVPPLNPQDLEGRVLRIGSYGDPAAIPPRIWRKMTEYATAHVGYTHQWRNRIGAQLKGLVMASVETPRQAERAQKRGWKTFRILRHDERRKRHESMCPASQGSTVCLECRRCDGAKRNVAIPVHGGPQREAAFHRTKV